MDGPLSHQGIASGKLPYHEPDASETDALTTLQKVFGYEAFRPGREAIIQTVLHGQNALAVMPTGSGKSLCIQIPALVLGGLTIVISPLVALMRDQVDALRLLGVGAECISSDVNRHSTVTHYQRPNMSHPQEGGTGGEVSEILFFSAKSKRRPSLIYSMQIIPVCLSIVARRKGVSATRRGGLNWTPISLLVGHPCKLFHIPEIPDRKTSRP